jgi:bla regulator protein BlaR1
MKTIHTWCWLLLVAAAGGAGAQEPDWQKAAGGKMAFEVATIRPSEPGTFKPPSFPLGPDDAYKKTGGVFFGDFPLMLYITFAYKLPYSPDQSKSLMAQLPKELADGKFTINAHGPATATKDQMRLMVQDLLAERFKLAVHYEKKELSVLVLTLKKAGSTGPKLIPHADGPPCVENMEGARPEQAEGVFPEICGIYSAQLSESRLLRLGSRDTTLDLIAGALPGIGQQGKTMINETGLTGRYDFTLEWVMGQGDVPPPPPPGGAPASEPPPAPQGPTFLEAVDEQLGMKLKAGKATLPILMVDHVEKPSEN